MFARFEFFFFFFVDLGLGFGSAAWASKVDIITSILHNRWGYIHKAYNATQIQHHNTSEHHPTTDETQTETQTTSTLLAQAADLEPVP